MTQKEIIEFEETNTGVIRLYLDGSFYRAYERSAFAFCTRVKDYRVLRKESKTLGRDILYVGFPMTALDRTLGNAMARKVSDTILDVILSYPMNENEFLQELPDSFRAADEGTVVQNLLHSQISICSSLDSQAPRGHVGHSRCQLRRSAENQPQGSGIEFS